MQVTFGNAERQGSRKRTRHELFVIQDGAVCAVEGTVGVDWATLSSDTRSKPAAVSSVGDASHPLIHALSDPAMEQALCDTPVMPQFTQPGGLDDTLDETTTLNVGPLFERHQLATAMFKQINANLACMGMSLSAGTIVDETIINAPSPTKNNDGKRGPKMHQAKAVMPSLGSFSRQHRKCS